MKRLIDVHPVGRLAVNAVNVNPVSVGGFGRG
jgi:hypothetical protein